MFLTFLLAQLIGLFCIAVGLFVLTRKNVFVHVVHEVEHNQPLIVALGLISIVLGLLVVLTHNVWDAGFTPFLITLIGWVMLIRGLLALFLPQKVILEFMKSLRVEKLYGLYGSVILVIGLYLTFAGFFG